MRIGLAGSERGARAADLVACFAYEGDREPRAIDDTSLRRSIAARMQAERFRGRRGRKLVLDAGGRDRSARLVVIGLGSPSLPAGDALRQGCARAARLARSLRAESLFLYLPAAADVEGRARDTRAAVEGLWLGAYRFDRYRTDPARKIPPLRSVLLRAPGPKAAAASAIGAGAALGRARAAARDLVNETPSTLSPPEFARHAAAEAKAAGLSATILGPREIARRKLGALAAVGRAGANPPHVVHLKYAPPGRGPHPRIVLVGKGVTFDSGGLDIKTSAGMLHMKGDMAGAAAVLAALCALPQVGCRAEVHGLLGLVENMIGPASYKPGDILKTHSGKTVEVTNTDAEGRLVLCDLLSYASSTLAPTVLVNLATLTGACVVALGRLAAGLFTRDAELSASLLAAADAAGERLWPMPMYEEYLEPLLGGPADLRNSADRNGGASIAALFLAEFVPKTVRWAHLDICGPSFFEKATPECAAGGTGVGVATLLRWLEQQG